MKFLGYITQTHRSPLLKKLISGALWVGLGSVFSRGLALLGILIIARILDKETFGHFSIIQSTITTAAIFAGLGLGSTATHHISQLKGNNITELNALLTLTGRLAMGSAILISLATILSASYIAQHILEKPELAVFITIGAASMFFNMLFGYYNAALLGFEAMSQSALAQIYASVVATPALIILTYLVGLRGAIIGLVAQGAILCGFSFFFYLQQRRNWGIKTDANFGRKEYQVLWTYTLPAFIFNLMIMPAHWISYTILVRSDHGSVEMATMGAAMQWYYMLIFLPSIIARVVFPALSKLAGQADQRDTIHVLRFTFLSNAAIAIPLASILAVISPWVMGLYGSTYIEDWPVLVMVLCAACIATLAMPFNLYVVASGRVWIATVTNLVWACTYILLSIHWIDQGALALAKAIFFAHIMQFIIMASFAYWKIYK